MAVTRLLVTPVKGTRAREVEQIDLQADGARGNRRFYVIDERDRMLNATNLGALQSVVADYREADDRLNLVFGDGRSVDGTVSRGATIQTRFFSSSVPALLVGGPWSAALSAHLGQAVRLVEPSSGAVDRGARGAVSLISRASIARLAGQAGQDEVDGRRFRMLIEVDDVVAHAEDHWVGRHVAVGQSVLRFDGHVGRCLITSRHPDTGEVDLPTLDLLREYRRDLDATEPLPFGVYGVVLQPGSVRLGDSVRVVEG